MTWKERNPYPAMSDPQAYHIVFLRNHKKVEETWCTGAARRDWYCKLAHEVFGEDTKVRTQ